MRITDGPLKPISWTSPAAAYRVTIEGETHELSGCDVAEALAWASARASGRAYSLDVVTPHGPGLVRLVGPEPEAPAPAAPRERPRSASMDGLVVELSRATVLPGASHEADRWMQMLDDRIDECVATLDAERMAVEIIFRLQEDGKDHLFWVAIKGPSGRGLDVSNPIDADHVAQAMRTKEPGWVEAEPQLLLLPAPVREAVEAWAQRP